MKLAEALIQRADIQKRIASLKDRITRMAQVQEGDEPVEAPEKLIEKVRTLAQEMESFIVRINRTNMVTKLADGQTLTAALARRDILALQAGVLRSAMEAATQRADRYSAKELRYVATLDLVRLQDRIDALGQELRELTTAVQAANWQVELA